MRLRTMMVLVALGACSLLGTAQMDMGAAGKPAASTMTEPAKALDDMLTLFESEVMGAVKAMPAEKYSFAPSAAIFAVGSPEKFDTVRTFGQQVAHVAQANYFFYSKVSGTKPDVDLEAVGKITTKDEAVGALAGSIAFGHKAIATITAANAFETIKGADGMNTRATLAAFGVAHGYDHYGQMVEYLRMNGIIPPASAK